MTKIASRGGPALSCSFFHYEREGDKIKACRFRLKTLFRLLRWALPNVVLLNLRRKAFLENVVNRNESWSSYEWVYEVRVFLLKREAVAQQTARVMLRSKSLEVTRTLKGACSSDDCIPCEITSTEQPKPENGVYFAGFADSMKGKTKLKLTGAWHETGKELFEFCTTTFYQGVEGDGVTSRDPATCQGRSRPWTTKLLRTFAKNDRVISLKFKLRRKMSL